MAAPRTRACRASGPARGQVFSTARVHPAGVRTPAPVALHLCADRPVSGTYTSAQKRNVKWECRLSAKPLSPEAGPGHTFIQRTRESLVPVPSRPSTGHCPPSQIRQRMGRGPLPAFPCPPRVPRALLWRPGPLCFCESAVPSLRFSVGPLVRLCCPSRGMGACPALCPAGMRNHSPSELGWWGPGADVCVCVLGAGAGQGRGGLRPGVLLGGGHSVG